MDTTTKAAKAPNYTDAMVETAKATYEALRAEGLSNKEVTKQIGADLGKTPRSVISKLTREGVYIKDEPGTPVAARDNGPSKKELLNDLSSAISNLDDDLRFDVYGLKGANKDAIVSMLAIVNSISVVVEDVVEDEAVA